jgi:hypothetical protein
MEEKAFLCLRTVWKLDDAEAFDPVKELRISSNDLKLADDHLNCSREFEVYIHHVMDTRGNKTALKDLPDLGVFTLVRHFQLQITRENVSDISPKHIISPIMTLFFPRILPSVFPSSNVSYVYVDAT